jgi:hypothetical protein
LADSRWALVERIAASRHFEHSAKLRDFLFYVCRRSLEDPTTPLSEHEIGCKVFDRPADFDTRGDTIVRVHASRLRRSLEQYFSTDGQHEPVVLTIPRGGYNPAWEAREAPMSVESPVPQVPPSRALLVVLAALSAALALACLALTVRIRTLRSAAVGEASVPTVSQQFWQEFWGKDRRTIIVLADSSLSLLTDLLGRPFTLADYIARAYENLPCTSDSRLCRLVMQRSYTSVADAVVATRLVQLRPGTAEVLFAREATARRLELDNVILIGSHRSNPWVELFSDSLNFRIQNEVSGRQTYVENRSPVSGEPSRYEGDQRLFGYSHIAFVPNLTRTRNVVIIAGTEMQSTEAGGVFLTTDHSLSELRRRLHLAPGATFPYFELVLQAMKVGQAGPTAKIIACRRIP